MFIQELHNPECLVAGATTFDTLTTVTCGPSICSLLIATNQTPRMLYSFSQIFGRICAPMKASFFWAVTQQVVVIT
jgi:hypothetical protein